MPRPAIDERGSSETRAERIARTEDRSRSLNQRDARRLHDREGVTRFRCECWQPECSDRVPLSGEEWRMVRAKPTQFAVVPGHVAENFEAVVEAFPGFWVVDKFGVAGEIAEQLAHEGELAIRELVGMQPR
jgi:hypothetical protein